MSDVLIVLHVTAGAIVVGVLFLQSLAVVMALRLRGEGQRQGVRILQRRLHLFIYYPILAVALLSGLWNAVALDAFADGHWLHWKLVAVVLLVGLGFATGAGIHARRVVKPVAMAVHIAVFCVSAWLLYLAVQKPF